MWFFVFLLGLAAGSFVNVIVYRLPKGLNPLAGRSKCVFCKKNIKFYDNIPLLSHFFLLGKCRNCKKPISIRYFLVELFTGISYVFIFLHLSSLNSHLSISYYLLFPILLAIFIIDLKHQIIPDSLVFILIVFAFMLALFNQNFYALIFTGFAAALFLLMLNVVTKGRGMGLGDVKYALFAGTFLGWPKTPVFFLVSFVFGAVVGIILILLKLAKFKKPVPFGPFLIIGTLFAALFDYIVLRLLHI